MGRGHLSTLGSSQAWGQVAQTPHGHTKALWARKPTCGPLRTPGSSLNKTSRGLYGIPQVYPPPHPIHTCAHTLHPGVGGWGDMYLQAPNLGRRWGRRAGKDLGLKTLPRPPLPSLNVNGSAMGEASQLGWGGVCLEDVEFWGSQRLADSRSGPTHNVLPGPPGGSRLSGLHASQPQFPRHPLHCVPVPSRDVLASSD